MEKRIFVRDEEVVVGDMVLEAMHDGIRVWKGILVFRDQLIWQYSYCEGADWQTPS